MVPVMINLDDKLILGRFIIRKFYYKKVENNL